MKKTSRREIIYEKVAKLTGMKYTGTGTLQADCPAGTVKE
jgi:hypothetical protein